MDDKSFSEIINNSKDITFSQVLKIIGAIKWKIILSFVAVTISVLAGAFAAGGYYSQEDMAVMLKSPFAMRIETKNYTHEFKNLVMIKDPLTSDLTDGKIILSLREVQNEFDIVPVGKVVAKVKRQKISDIWNLILAGEFELVKSAYADAEMVFNWNGHTGDYLYAEEFVQSHVVHRFYDDGCKLQYAVGKDRKSIRNSFVWLIVTH